MIVAMMKVVGARMMTTMTVFTMMRVFLVLISRVFVVPRAAASECSGAQHEIGAN